MSDQNLPRISVIIPTCHRNDLLAKCLDCLAPGTQTLPSELYEVIVTDDGSQSTAEQMVQENYPWAKWIAGPQRGPAANRNHGAALAQGDWLAFTDDDCLPDIDWLSALAAAMNGTAMALEGAIHPLGDMDQDMAECPVNLTGGYFWSANIAIEHSLFQHINGFDADYRSAAHEDQDIKIRLEPLTNILFVSEAFVSHPVRILPLKSHVKSLPKRCAAWAFHVNKHRNKLGYGGNASFMLHSYRFYIVNLFRNIYCGKLKKAAIAFSYLTFGLPIVGIALIKFERQKPCKS